MNRRLAEKLFIYSGAKFYFNWLLITNPVSKNPLIRFFWGWAKFAYSVADPSIRLFGSIILIAGHALWIGMEIDKGHYHHPLHIARIILGDVYPILVQLYIGYRCYLILQHKIHK